LAPPPPPPQRRSAAFAVIFWGGGHCWRTKTPPPHLWLGVCFSWPRVLFFWFGEKKGEKLTEGQDFGTPYGDHKNQELTKKSLDTQAPPQFGGDQALRQGRVCLGGFFIGSFGELGPIWALFGPPSVFLFPHYYRGAALSMRRIGRNTTRGLFCANQFFFPFLARLITPSDFPHFGPKRKKRAKKLKKIFWGGKGFFFFFSVFFSGRSQKKWKKKRRFAQKGRGAQKNRGQKRGAIPGPAPIGFQSYHRLFFSFRGLPWALGPTGHGKRGTTEKSSWRHHLFRLNSVLVSPICLGLYGCWGGVIYSGAK